MKLQCIANVFSVITVLVLFFLLIQVPSIAQQDVVPVLRARLIELVDDGGKTRAQLKVEPTGEVVFRMRDAKGTIRTKFSADQTGSGLSMMDDRTEATMQIRADQSGGSVIVIDREGHQKVIK